jgi:putative DNA primase/helicase
MSISSERTNVTNVDAKMYSDYATEIHRAGFNVIPMKLDSKAPDLPAWKQYTKRPQTEQEIQSMVWGPNIGIVNGINDIRTVDIDGCDDVNMVFRLLELLGLGPDYQWVVYSPGKGGGFHIYLTCPDFLTLTSAGVLVGDPLTDGTFQQIELRWSNCVTMFPPSIHPEAKEAYYWFFGSPAAPMANIPLTIIEKAFLTVATVQKKEKQPVKTLAPAKIPKYDAWAEKALNQELAAVREAAKGGRNAQLNRSAFALGQIIGAGLLDEKDVEDELTRTACAAGLDDKEIAATIKSGLAAGIKKPRMPKQVFKDNEPPLKLLPIKKVEDEKIANFSADDQGHAEAVYDLYGPYIAYNDAYGWMVWNGTHYTPSVQRINTLIVEVLRRRLRAAAHLERADLAKVSHSMAGTVSATRSMLENLAIVHVDEFDAEPDLINTLSGIVNLRTKKLVPHDPAYRFTWCAPVRYNPNADASLWLDFISSTVEANDMAGFLQEALGYSITGHISEESLFYIFGPPRSGKGTLSETILAILPRPIAVEVDFNTFTAKREGDAQNFDLAPLKPARLVFASESNKYQSLNPAKVKALTGGNMVYCAFKHKDMFNYRPQYTVWLSSNHEVNADADDDALWGRVKVVHFPYSQLGKEDKSLKRRMQSPENLEAVLAWLIDGAFQWYQHEGQGLQTPDAVKELTLSQREAQDSVGLWLEECCEVKMGEWVENSKVMTSYEEWCKANGYEPKKAKGLSQSLAAPAHGLEVSVLKWVEMPQGRKQMRGVRGLAVL